MSGRDCFPNADIIKIFLTLGVLKSEQGSNNLVQLVEKYI